MTKEDIVREVATDTGFQLFEVEMIIDALLDNITWALSRGKDVRFAGFGTFEPKKRAARTGRNPHTNTAVPIPARVIPSFKAGANLKKAVIKEA